MFDNNGVKVEREGMKSTSKASSTTYKALHYLEVDYNNLKMF
jgi:hypothetical protein